MQSTHQGQLAAHSKPEESKGTVPTLFEHI